ncbi:hypothetical protein K7432_012702 [Basidiobolus ranarum]|uniref:PX domain-containing protein n=1 Tax=Basidiobolus ranarum TaxID=34480 RepID=A0ABR2WKD6_9FUNG
MVALRASSNLVEPASYIATARVTSYELRREKCWFALSITPDHSQESVSGLPNQEQYIVYRLFSDFKYFASYLTLECDKYAEKCPKLTTRKRILSSKSSHADRRVEDINNFLSLVFTLPLNIRGSTCFTEFFGLWESDLSQGALATSASIDFSKATIPTVSSVQEAFESFELENSPVSSARSSLQRSNTLASCASSTVSEPPLKMAPWNVRHMTAKEKVVWQTKRSSLIRSYSCRSQRSGNVAVISPFVRIKVILNPENIVNILVPRNSSYDDLRKRIFEKFCENQAFKLEDFESVVLAYKRDNSLVVIATNEDLRDVLSDEIDKYTIYLPSAKLLDEFFWMREVAEISKTATSEKSTNSNRDSGYISYRSLSNESLRERFVQENPYQGHQKQKSLSALQRQNSFASLKRQNSLATLRNKSTQGSNLYRQNTMASLHQKTVLASLKRQNSEPSHFNTEPKENDSLDGDLTNTSEDSLTSKNRIFKLKVVLDSESCVVIPIPNNIAYSELERVIFKAFILAGYTTERLESLQLIYRTEDSHFLAVESDQDVRNLIATVRLDEPIITPNIYSLSLYLFPRGILNSLRRSGILLDIPLDMIYVS